MSDYKRLKLIALIALVISQGFMVWSSHQNHVRLMKALQSVEDAK